MTAPRGSAFATTHGVIDGVHTDATVMRTKTQPARPTGFADHSIFMIQISDLTDGRPAVFGYDSNFT